MSETAQQQLGRLAAEALDELEDGGDLVGAVLLVVERHPTDPSLARSHCITPTGQVWQMTLGIVEAWRQGESAEITASAVALEFEDDDQDDEE